jgi:hypothetical protein
MMLAGDLRLAVRLHALHHVALKRRQQLGALVTAWPVMVRVHIARRDECVRRRMLRKRDARRPHVARVTRDVRDEVPAAPGDVRVGVGVVAVRSDERHADGWFARVAASQAGDVVAAVDGCSCDLAAEPGCAAEDQDAHGFIRVERWWAGQWGSLLAHGGVVGVGWG